jgi:DNA-binding transcriptional MerR regulator
MLAHAQQDAPEPEKLFRIGDVSRLTDTKPFVLRFWETEFPMLQPVKTPKGHRLYRQEDVDLVRAIKRLLYEEGFTIPGARRHLSELIANGEGLASLLHVSDEGARPSASAAVRHPVLIADDEASATSAIARGLAAEPPAAAPRRHSADAPVRPRAAQPAELRQTLSAVGDELRAILTLLRTR